MPLLRVAISTGHGPLGLIVWQNLVMLALLRAAAPPRPAAAAAGRAATSGCSRWWRASAPSCPAIFTFLTAAALPAGVRSIIIAMIPMFVLPMALAMGFERPDAAAGARGAARRRRDRADLVLPQAGVTGERRRRSWCSSP